MNEDREVQGRFAKMKTEHPLVIPVLMGITSSALMIIVNAPKINNSFKAPANYDPWDWVGVGVQVFLGVIIGYFTAAHEETQELLKSSKNRINNALEDIERVEKRTDQCRLRVEKASIELVTSTKAAIDRCSSIVSNVPMAIEEAFAVQLPPQFSGILARFFEPHDFILQSTYSAYPHDYIRDSKAFLQPLNGRHHGMSVLARTDADGYARVATDFLKCAKVSVYSTTYIPNDRLVEYFNLDSVKYWIQMVNREKQRNGALDVRRVHLFTEVLKAKDQYGLDDFKRLMCEPTHVGSKQFYEEQFCHAGINKKIGWVIESEDNTDKRFLGEYIIFDKKAAISFSDTFNYMTIMFGDIVDELSKSFSDQSIENEVRQRWKDLPPW